MIAAIVETLMAYLWSKVTPLAARGVVIGGFRVGLVSINGSTKSTILNKEIVYIFSPTSQRSRVYLYEVK